jgi:hypothetical protein
MEAGTGDRARRVISIAGSAIFLVLAPGTVVGVIPRWISHWQVHAELSRIRGGSSLRSGVAGSGLRPAAGDVCPIRASRAGCASAQTCTPAPVLPTQHLVVRGSYRFVRNPMYCAVLAIVFAQALVFGDVRVAIYAAGMWMAVQLFVMLYEEPTLRRTFGAEYADYCANVPRWLPRLTPWSTV